MTLLGDSVRNLYSAGGPSAGRAIFTYRHINNLFMHSGQCLFNSSFHNYNTRSKHKLLQGGDIGLYILLSCGTVHLYCNIHMFMALVFILITYYSLA